MAELSERDCRLRLAVYQRWIALGRPPTIAELAATAGIAEHEARRSLQRLHTGHALLLDGDDGRIRIANPLSAVVTPYRVDVDGRWYFANCAWDSLGIPAMLHTDARIEAEYALSGETVTYAVIGGALSAPEALVHFALPFRRWYDDLVHT